MISLTASSDAVAQRGEGALQRPVVRDDGGLEPAAIHMLVQVILRPDAGVDGGQVDPRKWHGCSFERRSGPARVPAQRSAWWTLRRSCSFILRTRVTVKRCAQNCSFLAAAARPQTRSSARPTLAAEFVLPGHPFTRNHRKGPDSNAKRTEALRNAGPPLRPVPGPDHRRTAGPHLAGQGHHQGPALVRRGPARRQPGPDRPDEPGPQDEDVRPAGPHGLQGDRGRLPVRLADRLRLRPAADRGQPHPGRRHHPGADPGPRAPDRADLRVPGRREAGHRAPVQLHVGPAAPGRLQPGRGRHPGHRPAGRAAVQEVRGNPRRHAHHLRVLAGILHRHRAGVRRPGLQRRRRRLRGLGGPPGHHQPARHGGNGHPQRLRRLHRVDEPATCTRAKASSCPCTRTTTAAPASPPPSWATWPARTGSKAACSATASGPATWTW